MELQKGTCSLCHNIRIIASSEAKKAYRIICTLFSKKVLNILEGSNIQTSFELCPICHHKLTILNRLRKNIKEEDSNKSGTKCFLCKHGETLFKIASWHYFEEISQDLGFKHDYYITCSDCLFYLHARNELKRKLASKCPQLHTRTQNVKTRKQKIKLENTGRTFDHSTIETNEGGRSTFFNRSRNKIKRKTKAKQSVNFNSIKKLKPLRYSKSLKVYKIIQTDPKLFNKIPYVLLKVVKPNDNNKDIDNKALLNQTSYMKCEHFTAESGFTCMSEPKNKTIQQIINSKSVFIKTDSNRQHIVKNLVVKLSRIEMSDKLQLHMLGNKENHSNMKELNDKINIIQSKTRRNEVNVEQESLLECPDVSEERETCLRKENVSLSEDNDVPIQSFQNEIRKNYDHDNNLGNLSANSYFLKACGNGEGSISEDNPRTKQETFVAEMTRENVTNLKKSDVRISDKMFHELTEKIDSINCIDQEGRTVDEDIICKTSNTSGEYIPKNNSKQVSKIFDDLDNRSESMLISNAGKIPISKSEDTTSNTVQIRKDNISSGNNDESINSSDTFESSLPENLLNKDHRSNTHEETDILNLQNRESRPTIQQTEIRGNINIYVDDKKEQKLDSENTQSIHESKIVTDTNESKFSNITFINEKQYSDCKRKSENVQNDKFENVSGSIIKDGFEYIYQNNLKESDYNNTHKENCKPSEIVESSSFNTSEKNMEITEDDNINSILSNIISHQEQLEEKLSDNVNENSHNNENEKSTNDSFANCGAKRNLSDEEINKSADKKKKRVTFCETIT